VQIYGDQLRVFVKAAGARSGDLCPTQVDQIRAALAAQDIEVLDIRRTRPRMEEAFISLIRQRRAGKEDNR